MSPTPTDVTISPGPRMKTALAVAVVADLLQLVIFPMTIAGALSPVEDALDFGVAAILASLVGWHWEFLPAFLGELLPGADMFPIWTLAVANVYRKQKALAVASGEIGQGSAAPPNAGN